MRSESYPAQNSTAKKSEVRQYAVFLIVHALVYGIGFTIAFLP